MLYHNSVNSDLIYLKREQPMSCISFKCQLVGTTVRLLGCTYNNIAVVLTTFNRSVQPLSARVAETINHVSGINTIARRGSLIALITHLCRIAPTVVEADLRRICIDIL